ncbi:MAG TPA: carbonic anhydrase, partial [Gemmataceae bacterium]|nr:carbonic anhydrase [Gemmataceae bacterium]
MQRRITVAAMVLLALAPAARAQEKPLTGAQALERLKAGNVRFAADKAAPKDVGKDRRQELAKGQHPFALVLTCADSRVAPELVFDTGLGDLFVLRIAGNVADPGELGSIEYAVEELGVPLIVVMGHESCGAVKAAIDGGHLEGNLATLIKMVDPGKGLPADAKAALEAGVKNNVLAQTRLLTEKSKVIKEMADSKRVVIVSSVYRLASGQVEWIDEAKAGAGGEAAAAKKSTTITVRVPSAEARVWVDGTETRSRGAARALQTPPLTAGK